MCGENVGGLPADRGHWDIQTDNRGTGVRSEDGMEKR